MGKPRRKLVDDEVIPDYKRPFDQEDFRGYFGWNERLSERLGGHLYHACHEAELEDILDTGKLTLRSKWQLRLPEHGLWTVPGVWTGLNDFDAKNFYGPCLIKMPVSVLNGRQFMVFRREGDDRNRYFFVQHESGIPIYAFEDKPWRKVDPESYFVKSRGGVSRKSGAIYDLVLTAPLTLSKYRIDSVAHPKCIPEKCACTTAEESEAIMRRVATAQAKKLISRNPEIQAMLDHLPCLVGRKVPLERPDD